MGLPRPLIENFKMAKKQYFLIIDTETTMSGKVADFGAVVVDRKGNVLTQCAVLVDGVFTERENDPLFFNEDAGELWTKKSLGRRYDVYNTMVREGSRMIASVAAVNRWLAKVEATYHPFVTAYNIAFDRDKCNNTGIDLTIFGANTFCLWHAAFQKWGQTKKYLQFVVENHCFNAPTKLGNMSFKTNAEVMARFVLGNPELADEPHTALEDVIFYELPILLALLKNEKKAKWLNPEPFNWRLVQVKNFFKAA